MNIVVAMKQVPDLQQVRIRGREPVFDDVPLTLGNIDKNALQAGVDLKETLGGKVIILSAGNDDLEDTVKEGLAADGDEAYLVLDNKLNNASSEVIAKVLAAAMKNIDDVGLALFGEGSADNYSGQVGPRVAEILGWPEVGFAKKIEIKGNIAQVVRSLEDCEELVEVELPAVITVVSDINEAPIPSVTKILKAGKKPRETVTPDEISADSKSDLKLQVISNLAPESDRKRVVVKTVEELAAAIKSEGYGGK
ncbi:MAG: electron transfer flavoprotein subunit beta/FixA family protein [Methylocystaceae bacterium]